MLPQLVTAALLVATTPLVKRGETYKAVIAGKECKQQESGQVECEYRVGRSLHFGISGVGQPDAIVTFYRVSHQGDFYASVGTLHGCVIVQPGRQNPWAGMPDLAFVSPRTGDVFREWQPCRDAAVERHEGPAANP